jgi:peptidoglycan/xylan/chitin deacetylase (PgdA/CDA1 family)
VTAAVAAARQRAVPVLRASVKSTAAAVDRVRRPAPGITILIYHRVGAGTGGQMDLSPAAFDEQLAWLRATQRVLTLDQALVELGAERRAGEGATAPGSPGGTPGTGVVVTFDDGTADWVDHVLPALERHRVPATFYVATGFVDGSVRLPGDGAPISWAGLKELAGSELVTLGSHTHSHALMDRIAVPEIAGELDRSIELLEEMVGVRAEHFCYPKALPGSPPAEAAIRERFRSATIAGTRANAVGVDPYRLTRSPIQPTDGQRWFRHKAVGGMSFENDLRDLLNRVRYRGAKS